MPASLTASANPVGVWGETGTGSTTITWNTGSALRGRVYLTVADGSTITVTEALFDGNPTTGAVSGSKALPVKFGSTYTLVLRQVTNNAVLASLTVRVSDLQDAFIDQAVRWSALDHKFNPPQAIYNLKVSAGIDTCRVRFKTVQPTVPAIEAVDAGGNVVGSALPLFGGLRTEHDVLLGEIVPLPQATELTLKIVAAGHTTIGHPTQVQFKTKFTTGSRYARINFEELDVRNDGDPGIKGAGDFHWGFNAGDADSGTSLGDRWLEKDVDDENGPVVIREQISIARAPRRLWVAVLGQDDDTSIIGAPGILGSYFPPFEGQEGSWYYNTPQMDETWVERHFDISGVTGGNFIPMELNTGDFAVAFKVKGKITVDTVDGVSPVFAKAPKWGSGKVFEIDKPGAFSALRATLWTQEPADAGRPRLGHVLGRGPDGAVYRQIIDAAAPRFRPDQGWKPAAPAVDGVVTAAMMAGDRLALFALDGTGAVLQADLDQQDRPGQWRSLGGRFTGTVGVVTLARSVELVTHDSDGAVFHRDANGEWQRIGEGIQGAPKSLALDAAGFAVFALGRRGQVLMKRCRDGRWQSKDWRVIEGVRGVRIGAAGMAGQGFALAVLGEDMKLYTIAAQDERGLNTKGWVAQGDLQTWLTRTLEPRPARAKAKKTPDKKTRPKIAA